ncbi:hypothetical protein RhiirA4_465642 [Rhizophagus irregularis]|uniref:SAM domain-containing protein n=1 Tax=Rhizophagus irregularis TaxID=588596 RepID=A0A2I1GSG8_9GLOM|nr:hypothetical protein RhiirA4_465642 [Rhizophagus irregularis]
MSETSTPYTPASISTTVAENEMVSLAEEIKKYKTESLIKYLRKEEDLDLDDDNLKIFRKQKIMGRNFLKMSKKDLSEVLAEYGLDSDGQDWHFLLYSPGKISKASDTAYSIEFTKKALDPNSNSYKSLCNSVKEVLEIVIVGLLKDRACAEKEPDRKRARIEELSFEKINV